VRDRKSAHDALTDTTSDGTLAIGKLVGVGSPMALLGRPTDHLRGEFSVSGDHGRWGRGENSREERAERRRCYVTARNSCHTVRSEDSAPIASTPSRTRRPPRTNQVVTALRPLLGVRVGPSRPVMDIPGDPSMAVGTRRPIARSGANSPANLTAARRRFGRV
jgi:hypothetical protein